MTNWRFAHGSASPTVTTPKARAFSTTARGITLIARPAATTRSEASNVETMAL
jgi:hypothetical protein